MTPVGDHAIRISIPEGAPRAALLAWLLELPGVVDASLAAEHALVVFEAMPVTITIPTLVPEKQRAREHVIRVVYDGDDLDEVARLASLSRDEVIARHLDHELEVSFLGFCPGFAYLVGLDATLATIPRRDVPRTRVPAEAVAIAGGYAGIYPASTPGGWRLIGRAIDARLLDAETPRLAVGDRVRFVRA